MSSAVTPAISISAEAITVRHDQRFIYPATRADALRLLESVRARIEAMEEFERFPEGPGGVVVVALLAELSLACPDSGDLGYLHRGLEQALASAFDAIVDANPPG
jgi:hypothetical protein